MNLPNNKQDFDALIEKVKTWQRSIHTLTYPHNTWNTLKDFAKLAMQELMPFDGMWPSKDISQSFIDLSNAHPEISTIGLTEEEISDKYDESKMEVCLSLEKYIFHLERQHTILFGNAN